MGASSEIIHQEFATNVFGPIFLTKATIDHIPEGGRIINVGSVGSKVGPVEAGIYAATKAALNSLTYTWAAEVRIKTPYVFKITDMLVVRQISRHNSQCRSPWSHSD
jgi:NAD(P)-dependent dehydrogenase (short-subunit alcohol dehydrogenase family)